MNTSWPFRIDFHPHRNDENSVWSTQSQQDPLVMSLSIVLFKTNTFTGNSDEKQNQKKKLFVIVSYMYILLEADIIHGSVFFHNFFQIHLRTTDQNSYQCVLTSSIALTLYSKESVTEPNTRQHGEK